MPRLPSIFLTGSSTSTKSAEPPLPAQRSVVPAPHSMVGFPTTGGLVPYGVTPTTALGLSAVWRSLDILGSICQLAWYERRGDEDLIPSRLVRRPMVERTRREWTVFVVNSLALWGVAYLVKMGGVDSEGVPMGLWPVSPDLVSPVRDASYTLTKPSEYMIGNVRVSADDLVVLERNPRPGVEFLPETSGVLQLARQTFAQAIAADNYASRYWQAGGVPGGNYVIEADSVIPDVSAQQISDRWAQRRSMGPDYAPVLDRGLKVRTLGADPTTDSAVEARKELVSDIGRYFGIGASFLNSPNQSSETYSTTEYEGINLVTYTLAPYYIAPIEDAISDLLPGALGSDYGRRLVIDPAPLMRGTRYAQAQGLQLATGGRAWLTPDEARAEWGLPPAKNPSDLEPTSSNAPVANGAKK